MFKPHSIRERNDSCSLKAYLLIFGGYTEFNNRVYCFGLA